MSKLYKDGLIKAIGVSNFYPARLTDFCLYNEIIPQVNRIELNPFHQRVYEQSIHNELGIKTQSWASFAEGKNKLFHNAVLTKIANKHNKSVAQIVLRWLVERGIIMIPKSVNIERMQENFSIFDFSLDSNDMQEIARLDTKTPCFHNHEDTECIKWFKSMEKGL